MASPSKKRDHENDEVEDEFDDDDSSDFYDESLDSDGSENDEPENENVRVDFEGNTASENDGPGIQKLLQQLFLKANVNVAELTDYIIAHNFVGCVLKQGGIDEPDDGDDDDDEKETVYGVTTVINLTFNKDLEFVKQIVSLLHSQCERNVPSLVSKLNAILADDARHVGFVINERFINIPAQVSLPAFETMWKEAEQATKRKEKYKFKYLVLIAKTYRRPKTAKRGKKKSSRLDSESDNIFINLEEELFYKEAELTFHYSVKDERDVAVDGAWDLNSDELEPMRTVIVVSADYVPSIMAKIEELYPVPAADT